MKTNIASLTASLTASLFALLLAPAVLAAPVYGPKASHRSKPQAAPGCCVSGPCMGKDCCTTKVVSNGPTKSGRMVRPASRVRDCNANCPIAAANQRADCQAGTRT
jgi:hypothetical protein